MKPYKKRYIKAKTRVSGLLAGQGIHPLASDETSKERFLNRLFYEQKGSDEYFCAWCLLYSDNPEQEFYSIVR